MLREIVIDTETTGLDPANGDRLIELGCIEIVNRIPTGREFHRYLNPERDIHRDVYRDVHRIRVVDRTNIQKAVRRMVEKLRDLGLRFEDEGWI